MLPPSSYEKLGALVAFPDIDRELNKLISTDGSSVRASLMNLVVFSAKKKSLIRNQMLVQDILLEHACRALIVELNVNAGDNKSYAWITAHCRLRGGDKTVCNEQIAFLLNGHVRGRIPNTVFAHLDSDLPLVFWWQGELSYVFRPRLYKRMNRFIFDSAEWEEPHLGYKRVLDARADCDKHLILHDLEWARTFHLRSALSMMFDEKPALHILSNIERIRIVYNPAFRMAAVLLLTWISRQVNLSFKSRQGNRLRFITLSGRIVEFDFVSDENVFLVSELSFHVNGYHLSLIRDSNSPLLEWNIDLADCKMTRMMPADPVDEQSLVAGQLARGGSNSVFNELMGDVMEMYGKVIL